MPEGRVDAQRQFEAALGAKRTTEMRNILRAVTAINPGAGAVGAEA